MSTLNIVLNKINKIRHLIGLLALTVLLISCCPKDGVDKSVYYNDYNLTLEISNSVLQKPITFLDRDSKVTIVLNNSVRHDSQYFSSIASDASNRFTFMFDQSIKDEDISSIEVKLIDYKDQNLNFKTIPKTPFQRNAEPVAKSDSGNIWCSFANIAMNWIIPRAEALSCATKKGSLRTFRSGQLIPLSLQPEDP